MKKISTVFTVIVLVALTVVLSSSKSVIMPNNCPNNPTVSVTTDQANYIHATALLKTYKDGYEWTVTQGGFIMSGQGTNMISIGPDCPSGTIIACVRAYINQPGGGVCYSAQICGSVDYTGPCFIL